MTGYHDPSNQQWLPAQDFCLPSDINWNDFDLSSTSPFNMDRYLVHTEDIIEDVQKMSQTGFPLPSNVQHICLSNNAVPSLAVTSNPSDSTTPYSTDAHQDALANPAEGAVFSSFDGYVHSSEDAMSLLHQATAIHRGVSSQNWAFNQELWGTEVDISPPIEAQVEFFNNGQFNGSRSSGLVSSYDGSLGYNSFPRKSTDSRALCGATQRQEVTVTEITQLYESRVLIPPRPVVSKSRGSRLPAKDSKAHFTLQSGISKFHTAKPRKKFSNDRRKEVAATRQAGACFRCRMWKITCRQGSAIGLCERCSSGGASLHSICFRLDLSDCGFYRTGSAIQKAPLRKEIDWKTSMNVTLTLTMATVPGAPPLYIDCRPFRPVGSDQVADWIRGEEIGAIIEIPTYAAVDLQAVEQEVRSKARPFGKAFLDAMEADSASALVVRTIRGAFAYADKHPNSMVNVALDLWACSRMCARDRSLEGEETLGQERVADPLSPFYNQVPIPPMLDYQCDMVTIKWMGNLASGLLKTLWKKLGDKKMDDWFEVFLVVFIMLNNVEFVYGIAKELAYQYGMNAGETGVRIQRTIAGWLEKWSWSAKHLLYVYKTFFKTGYPFSDQALVDAANSKSSDAATQSLMAYLLQFRDSTIYKDNNAKSGDDFDYELFWTLELFKEY